MWGELAAAVGGNLIGGYMQGQAQKGANIANKQMSREQMRFQERMSSTAHQRQVADLKAAGLNPILSANTGASAPTGSMATAEAANEAQGLENAVSSALEVRRLKKDIELADQAVKTQQQEIKNKKAQEKQTKTQTTLLKATEPAARMVNKIGKSYESATSSAKDVKRHLFEKSHVKKAESQARKNYKKSQAYKDARRRK